MSRGLPCERYALRSSSLTNTLRPKRRTGRRPARTSARRKGIDKPVAPLTSLSPHASRGKVGKVSISLKASLNSSMRFGVSIDVPDESLALRRSTRPFEVSKDGHGSDSRRRAKRIGSRHAADPVCDPSQGVCGHHDHTRRSDLVRGTRRKS